MHFELLRKIDNAARDSSGKGLLLKEEAQGCNFRFKRSEGYKVSKLQKERGQLHEIWDC